MTGAHAGLETLLKFFVLRRINNTTLRSLEHLKGKVADILGGILERP